MRLISVLFFLSPAFAQSGSGAGSQIHQVILAWQDNANPVGTTYNIYRSTGVCPATPPPLTSLGTFAVLNTTPITVKTFIDSTVVGGQTYCYAATASNAGQQSNLSSLLPAPVPTIYVPLLTVTIAQ